MSSCDVAVLVSALACSIAQTYTNDETALLAAVFTQLGDTLTTIDVSNEINSKSKKNS